MSGGGGGAQGATVIDYRKHVHISWPTSLARRPSPYIAKLLDSRAKINFDVPLSGESKPYGNRRYVYVSSSFTNPLSPID